jgi:hypothetical protein
MKNFRIFVFRMFTIDKYRIKLIRIVYYNQKKNCWIKCISDYTFYSKEITNLHHSFLLIDDKKNNQLIYKDKSNSLMTTSKLLVFLQYDRIFSLFR